LGEVVHERRSNRKRLQRLPDGRAASPGLKNITLNIEDGVFLAIAGPSGSGKSTLLNMMGCIDTPSRGKIFIKGQDVSGEIPDQLSDLRARTIGFIF
jgi:putative ABC transport system ATP-binding protein